MEIDKNRLLYLESCEELVDPLKDDIVKLINKNEELDKENAKLARQVKNYDENVEFLGTYNKHLNENNVKLKQQLELSVMRNNNKAEVISNLQNEVEILKSTNNELELESETLYTADYVRQITEDNKKLKELLLGYRNSSQELLNAINRYFHD